MSALLQIHDFCVSYRTVEAVHNIALQVDEGEIVTVIGPNGAGKTTLLCAAMGLLPSTGSLTLAGERIARPSVEALVARGVALVPERRELFGEMSVEDNLLLGGFYRWRKGSATRRRGCRRSSRYSRGCASGGRRWPRPCRAASTRCWRSAAR